MSRQSLIDNLINSPFEGSNRLFCPYAEQLFQSLDLQKASSSKPLNFKQKRFNNHSRKTEIFSWFSSVSLEQRQAITQIFDETLVEMLITYHQTQDTTKISFQKTSSEKSHSPSFRSHRRPASNNPKSISEKALIKNFRVLCLSKPFLYLRSEYLEQVELFLGHLDQISTHQIFQYGCKNHQTGNPLWFCNLTFNTLGQWLCYYLEEAIQDHFNKRFQDILETKPRLSRGRDLIQFFHDLPETKQGSILTDQIRSLFKGERGMKCLLDLQPKQITNGSICLLSSQMRILEGLYQQEKSRDIVIEDQIVKPARKKNTRKKRRPYQKQHLNANKSSMTDEVNSLGAGYQGEGSLEDKISTSEEHERIQTEIAQPQTPRAEQQAEKSRLLVTCSSLNNLGDVEERPLNSVTSYEQIGQEKHVQVQNTATHSKQQQEGEEEEQIGETEFSEECSAQKGESVQDHGESQSTSDVNEQVGKKKKKNKRRRKIPEDLMVYLFNTVLDSNLNRFVDNLSIESNNLLDARILVFDRIRYFIMKLYGQYTVDAKLFGSNAAGLALPTSDIDILLTGFSLDTQQQSVALLEHLSVQLKRMKWVVSCQTYLHAKVPIVKLEVNANIKFLQTTNPHDSIPQLYTIKKVLDTDTQVSTLMKVDLTVEAKKTEYSHLGWMSTEFMKGWLSTLPHLNPLMLIMKYLMSVKGLNRPYKGGLSSYCLLIMVASYLKQITPSFKGSKYLGEQFIEVLNFYCNEFESESNSVCLWNERCFFKTGQEKFMLNVIDPINHRVMTANCTEYSRIKLQFKRVRDALMNISTIIANDLRQLSAAEIKTMHTKKKVAEKWAKKYDSIDQIQIQTIIRNS